MGMKQTSCGNLVGERSSDNRRLLWLQSRHFRRRQQARHVPIDFRSDRATAELLHARFRFLGTEFWRRRSATASCFDSGSAFAQFRNLGARSHDISTGLFKFAYKLYLFKVSIQLENQTAYDAYQHCSDPRYNRKLNRIFLQHFCNLFFSCS